MGAIQTWFRRAASRGASTVGPIGLQFAREHVHFVQMDYARGRPVIGAAVSLRYPDGDRATLLADPRRLRALVRQAKRCVPLQGGTVVSCLPGDSVQLMLVDYTVADGRDPAASIVAELRERMKEGVDDSVIDYLPIRANGESEAQARSAIAAVARRDVVTKFLDTLGDAGLDPIALDIGPAALCRMVGAMHDTADSSDALLVTFGQERSYLTVIWGRRLMLDRAIDFGESALVGRVGQSLDVPPELAAQLLRQPLEQAPDWLATEQDMELSGTLAEVLRPAFARLANEVNRTLVYVASQTRGRSVDRMYVVGSAARYPRIVDWLRDVVTLPVSVLDPLASLGVASPAALGGGVEASAGLAVAAGLALRGGE